MLQRLECALQTGPRPCSVEGYRPQPGHPSSTHWRRVAAQQACAQLIDRSLQRTVVLDADAARRQWQLGIALQARGLRRRRFAPARLQSLLARAMFGAEAFGREEPGER